MSAPETGADGVLARALSLADAGQFEEAKILSQRVVQQHPDCGAAWYVQGLAADAKDQPQDAILFLSRATACDPQSVPAHVALGDVLARAERLEPAITAFRRALDLQPALPDVLNNLGNALRGLGRIAEALDALGSAAALLPDDPMIAYNLGSALRQAGRLHDAERVLHQCVALSPSFAEAYNNLGLVLYEQGRIEEAVVSFRQSAHRQPGSADAQYNLGLALNRVGAFEAAIAPFRQALAIASDRVDALTGLGAALRGANALTEAIPVLRRAADHCLRLPGDQSTGDLIRLGDYADAVAALPASQAALFADDIMLCLEVDGVDHQSLARVGIALLATRIDIPALLDGLLSETQDGSVDPWPDALSDPLLLRLMRVAILPDRHLEVVLTALRHRLLRVALGVATDASQGATSPRALAPSPAIELATALAAQCHLNGHVFPVSDREAPTIDAVHRVVMAALARGDRLPALPVLALISYHPLPSLGLADEIRRWAAMSDEPLVRDLVAQHLDEPLARTGIANGIPQLTTISAQNSVSVRCQYEEDPYPAWQSLNRPRPRPLSALLQDLFPHAAPPPQEKAPSEILVVGCGTGRQAIETALRHPEAQVLALDLSRKALAYGAFVAQRLNVRSVSFAQADLLACGDWGRRFDLVEAVGVLHHLADPAEGWRIVSNLTRPGGVLRIGLYSRIARQPVTAAQARLSERHFPATPDGIRAGRQALLDLAPDDPATPVTRATDFYSLSGCRDLLFHVKEQTTTVAEIRDQLAAHDLSFLGFELPSAEIAGAYDLRFLNDPARLSFDNWATLEASRPDIFAGMYIFWAQKKA